MPDYVYGNFYLSQTQREYNAQYIYNWLTSNTPYSFTARIAMLGNWEQESTLNPGLWQNKTVGTGGYGLAQWTPASKLFNWTRPRGYEDWNMDGQLLWIRDYTVPYGQWRQTSAYPITWEQFYTREVSEGDLSWSLADAVRCYCQNWEQAGNAQMPNRIRYANFWWQYFSGEVPPIVPDWEQPDTPDYYDYHDGMPLYFYGKLRPRRF